MNCPDCEKTVEPDHRFCPECGNPQTKIQTPEPTEQNKAPEAEAILARNGVTSVQGEIWQVNGQRLLTLTAKTERRIQQAVDRLGQAEEVILIWGPGQHEGDWRADLWLTEKALNDHNNRNRAQAQQALETYDREGEAALLDFLIVHRKPNPYREEARSHWERGQNILDDSSVQISLHPEVYTFTWKNQRETRPASPLAQTMPLPPVPNAPLLNWPSVESITHEVIRLIEWQTRAELDTTTTWDDSSAPILNDYQRLTLAPPPQRPSRRVCTATLRHARLSPTNPGR